MFTSLDVQALGYSDAEYQAAKRYLRRKARQEQPSGTWDRVERFFLDEPTVSSVRSTSRAYSPSELKQAPSIKHGVGLKNADEKATRHLVKLLEAASDDLNGHEKLSLAKRFKRKARGTE